MQACSINQCEEAFLIGFVRVVVAASVLPCRLSNVAIGY